MKKSDDVFFFTLIDFLLQVFFFGLLLFALNRAYQEKMEANNQSEQRAVEKIKNLSGVSNLTELTDLLSKLGPLNELKGTADFISHAGGVEKIKAAIKITEQAGGIENIGSKLEKLKKLEEGSGRPPCLFTANGEKKIPKPLATVVATDTNIIFQENSPELAVVLQMIGQSYDAVRELSMQDFRRTFTPLLTKKADCRYTLRFLESTRFVYARDAARFAFYLNIENKK